MTQEVISIAPDATVADAIGLMRQHQISGLPVLAPDGHLVGMVTEGDLLRRAELGTERPRFWWTAILFDQSKLASDYVRAHAKSVSDVMTRHVLTVTEETPLEEAVSMMERHQIKRLPVMRGRHVVGIVSRANLLHALGMVLQGAVPTTATDKKIEQSVNKTLHTLSWSGRRPHFSVRDGIVDIFWIGSSEDWERQGLRVAVENLEGVKKVRDNFPGRS
jgi:CBS domain-containing protein